ncbi:E-selectin-like [Branchiostoma floridae x Branchiostoma japonicum]
MRGSTSYRGSLRFTCDRGYSLVGAKKIRCQADGTWSDSVPTCKAIRCPTLTPPENGAVKSSNSYRDVTFKCDPGYKLVGTSTRTCQSDGTWSGGSPTCRAECRNGYQLVAQTCIRVPRDKKNHNDAQAACEREGATLAMPKTRELDVSLRNWIRKFGMSQYFWIGLKLGAGKIWKWADGSRIAKHDYKKHKESLLDSIVAT